MFTITINTKTPEEFKEAVKLLYALFPEGSSSKVEKLSQENVLLRSRLKQVEAAGISLIADAKDLVLLNEKMALENSVLRGKEELLKRLLKDSIGK